MSADAKSRSRLDAARVRARGAKWVLGAGAVVVFLAGAAAARATVAGHAHRPIQPLAPPPRFVHVVRKDALQAGLLAPQVASPGVATAQS